MTRQTPDQIIYRGILTTLQCELLPSFPENHPRISRSTETLFSTACYRGYEARWEICERSLYLLSVEGRFTLEGPEPLFADWFSGRLVIHYEWRGPEHGVFADRSRWLNNHAHLLKLCAGVIVQTKRAKYCPFFNCFYEPRDHEADMRQIMGDAFADAFYRNGAKRDRQGLKHSSEDRDQAE